MPGGPQLVKKYYKAGVCEYLIAGFSAGKIAWKICESKRVKYAASANFLEGDTERLLCARHAGKYMIAGSTLYPLKVK